MWNTEDSCPGAVGDGPRGHVGGCVGSLVGGRVDGRVGRVERPVGGGVGVGRTMLKGGDAGGGGGGNPGKICADAGTGCDPIATSKRIAETIDLCQAVVGSGGDMVAIAVVPALSTRG